MFRGNPIYKKEVRTGTHTARLALLIIVFNVVLAVVAFAILYNTINGVKSMGALDYSGLTNLYTVMAYIEFCIIAFIVPAITAGSVVGEKERQTLDVMLASKVRPGTVIWGKLMACMQIIVCVCISSLPVLSIVFIYGGIRFWNLLMLIGVIICTGFFLGSIGIFSSCVCKKTTSSVVMAYAGLIVTVFVTCGVVYIASKLSNEIGGEGTFVEIVSHIMLLNPASTIVDLVGEQLEYVSYFEKLLFNGVELNNKDVMQNWVVYSIIVQLVVGVINVSLSAWILNPLKFNLWRRLKKLYGKRKSKDGAVTN